MKEKTRYKVYSYRLNDGTAALLKKLSLLSGKSYNRFLFQLLTAHENKKEILPQHQITPDPKPEDREG